MTDEKAFSLRETVLQNERARLLAAIDEAIAEQDHANRDLEAAEKRAKARETDLRDLKRKLRACDALLGLVSPDGYSL